MCTNLVSNRMKLVRREAHEASEGGGGTPKRKARTHAHTTSEIDGQLGDWRSDREPVPKYCVLKYWVQRVCWQIVTYNTSRWFETDRLNHSNRRVVAAANAEAETAATVQ